MRVLTIAGRFGRDPRAVPNRTGDSVQSTQGSCHPCTETSERVCRGGTLVVGVPPVSHFGVVDNLVRGTFEQKFKLMPRLQRAAQLRKLTNRSRKW